MTQLPLVFIDPRPQIAPTAELSAPMPWRQSPGRATFGMLANGFPDSAAFLRAVAVCIEQRHPGSRFRHVAKARPPDVLTEDQVAVLTGECNLVIAAYGH